MNSSAASATVCCVGPRAAPRFSLEIVDARLAESADAARIRAADAIAAARRRFGERYAHMEAALQTAIIATVEDTYAPKEVRTDALDLPGVRAPSVGLRELRRRLGARLGLLRRR